MTQTPSVTTRMAQEIAEQPRAVEETLRGLHPLRDSLAALAHGRRHVLFVARGTSDNAAIYGRYLVEAYAGMSAALAAPSIATHYHADLDLSDTLVVSVSQSGQTEEIVATQAWARAHGGHTVAVTNVADSALVAGADLALVTRAGLELAVPATKTYLAQLAAMATVATALSPTPSSIDDALDRVPDEIRTLLATRAGVPELADLLARSQTIVVSGRGLLLGTALEVALKIEETCLRPVRGYSYADLRHGPISVVEEGVTAVLVSAQDGPLVAGMTELARDLAARGSTVVGIGGDAGFAAACRVHVRGPDLPEAVAPFGAVVPAQLAIEATARRLGLDPDSPRGLAKVTSTEAGRAG